MQRFLTAVLAAVLLGTSGCAFSIGGGSTEEVHHKTWGRQLLELKQALDQGALTQKEFDEAKRRILRAAHKE